MLPQLTNKCLPAHASVHRLLSASSRSPRSRPDDAAKTSQLCVKSRGHFLYLRVLLASTHLPLCAPFLSTAFEIIKKWHNKTVNYFHFNMEPNNITQCTIDGQDVLSLPYFILWYLAIGLGDIKVIKKCKIKQVYLIL